MSITRGCPTCGYTASYTSDAMAEHHHPRHSCAKQQRYLERAHARAARTKAGPKRNCRHPRAKHQHGTRAAYVKDQCRCAKCTAVNTAASNEMHRERTFGRWEPYLDSGPTRAHIEDLRAAGIGVDQIAKLAGLSSSHVRGLIYPSSTGKPPYQRVRRETAERILAVPVEDSSRAANSHVDATGTRRRLQALIAVGWAQAWLARELHRSPANFRRSMTADTVTARTAQLVNEMYERLWAAPLPQQTSSQRNASDAARAHAVAQGWLPPLAWDDIDTDPDPDPNQPDTNSDDDLDEIAIERAIAGDTRVRLTYAEQIEVVRRMSERGRSIRTIADLLSTSKRTVSRHRRQGSAA
jgi:AraC-like DNA-binding protein/DNA-binding CsgD family transcriptional regulator